MHLFSGVVEVGKNCVFSHVQEQGKQLQNNLVNMNQTFNLMLFVGGALA